VPTSPATVPLIAVAGVLSGQFKASGGGHPKTGGSGEFSGSSVGGTRGEIRAGSEARLDGCGEVDGDLDGGGESSTAPGEVDGDLNGSGEVDGELESGFSLSTWTGATPANH
jgi:hypothetical protein